ncbi:MAG: YceI family protein [Bdellovibrionaceae bacterium]|nr:YceI family protein [Pseudobdellovibrionaceae bacterium]
MKSFVMLCSIFVAFSSFNAEAKKADKKKAAKEKAVETFKVDTEASTATWVGIKKIGDKHTGHVKIKEGKVDFKEGKLTSGSFVFDMNSITNDDLKDKPDYQTKLVSHLKSDDFFKVEKNPESKFEITSVKEKDGKPWISGKLTLIGKTETLEFPADITVKDGIATGTAKLEVDRTKWGLTYGSGNFFKELVADKIINDKFEISVNLTAKK